MEADEFYIDHEEEKIDTEQLEKPPHVAKLEDLTEDEKRA